MYPNTYDYFPVLCAWDFWNILFSLFSMC